MLRVRLQICLVLGLRGMLSIYPILNIEILKEIKLLSHTITKFVIFCT